MATKPLTAKTIQNLEPTCTGLASDTLQRAVLDNLAYLQARYPDIATVRIALTERRAAATAVYATGPGSGFAPAAASCGRNPARRGGSQRLGQ